MVEMKRVATAAGLAVLVTAAVTLSGCSKTPHYRPGCYLNSAVKSATRQEIEAAADRFYGLLRSSRYDDAYAEAAEALRTRVDRNQITQSWMSLAQVLTIPQEPKTEEIAVAVFAPGTRGPQQISCIDPADASNGRTIATTDQPFQAYLVQSADVQGTTYNYASVWYFEGGQWKLATFGAKPRQQLGHDWRYYLDEARLQKQKGNLRNSALLYNLALDLMVPAPWVKPDMVTQLQQEQRKIAVENLPAGRKLEWVAADSTVFHPYRVNYDMAQGRLTLHVWYEVPAPVDTAKVEKEAPSLANFIRATFPEYAEVFSTITLEATSPLKHETVWTGTFPIQGS